MPVRGDISSISQLANRFRKTPSPTSLRLRQCLPESRASTPQFAAAVQFAGGRLRCLSTVRINETERLLWVRHAATPPIIDQSTADIRRRADLCSSSSMTIQQRIFLMTAIAFCRIPLRDLVRFRIGLWTFETSDEKRQDKANWRSRTRRSSAIEKPLSAHWFLEALRPAPDDVLTRYGWLLSSFPKKSNAPRDGARGLRFEPLRILFRSRARDCDFMRSTHRGSCAGPVR